tara:strand:+ start:14023 stop:15141 length:1119 start_codon:yes stop_codon:yes gene_type:complete
MIANNIDAVIRLFPHMLDAAADGFLVTDPNQIDNPIIYASQAFVDFTGYSLDEILGKNCRFLQGDDSNPQTIQHMHQAVNKPEKFQGEILNYRKNGESFWNAIRIEPIFSDTGKLLYFVGVQTDITQQKHMQQQLQTRQDELAHLLRVHQLETLSTGIFHELSQPLTAIANYIAGGLKRLMDNPESDIFKETLQKIERQSNRAHDIIYHLRHYGQHSDLLLAPDDINNIINDALLLTTYNIRHYDVTLELKLAEATPTIQCDAIQLMQVLVNLITNAVEAMHNTPVAQRHLLIQTSPIDNTVNVVVKDNGQGISAENIDKVFKPFFTTKKTGMGMGLDICQDIIKRHHGNLTVESTLGQNCQFTISLPISTE